VILLGAEMNRGIIEVRKLKDNGMIVDAEQQVAATGEGRGKGA
jgi:hypothetical protein